MNFIPIIITYIILYDCTTDGCLGKFFIWFTIPIWAIIYLLYFTLNEKINNSNIKNFIIYSPSLLTSIFGVVLTVIKDKEIVIFIYVFLILILPTLIYNIFVEYKLNKNYKLKFKIIIHPITIIIATTLLVSITYKPKFYSKDVFTIGNIEVRPSLTKIEFYLSDSTIKNKYLLPNNIRILPYPDYKDWIDKNDYFLYFKENPTEVIHIKIIDWTVIPIVEIKGIKTLKEKYVWQWRVNVKKNDMEAIRVLNRIENTLIEIDPKIKTKININAP